MNNPYFIVERVGMDTYTCYNKYPEFQAWEEGKQSGIKELLEWIETNAITTVIPIGLSDTNTVVRCLTLDQIEELKGET